MPGFGAILVELAYKAKTIMMKLTLENEPKAEFMKSKAPLLRERFTEAGYELTQFDITHGNIREISPSWKDEEHLREGIFA